MKIGKSKLKLQFLLFIGFPLLIFNCTKTTEEKPVEQQILKIYNWENYIGSNTITDFTEKTGIEVILDHYEDEEEIFSTISSDLSAYDLVVASDDMVREMILKKILSKIDISKIPNFKNVDPQFLNLDFDPNQQYSVPYLWGTTGMIINKKYIHETDESWSILFSNQYINKIAMLNNPFELFAPPLKLLGESINPDNLEIIEKAEQMLIIQKEFIYGYLDVMTIVDLLISEEIWAAQIYSGEGISAIDENKNLVYMIPREGAPIWLDNFVIPRDSKNIEAAYKFLNYINIPEVNATIATELWYATTNLEALQYIEQEVLELESVYPDEKTIKRCEYFLDIGVLTNNIIKKWNKLDK